MMKSGGILGKEVIGSGGWKIGKITELVFDENSWRIGSIEVVLDPEVAKEYEMKKLLSRTTINVDVSSVHAIGTHVILSITKPELREMISHKKDETSSGPPAT
jgi:sporulation protein YlmC with PRC-barrel domain